MDKDVIHSLSHGERVTSSYADIYLDDEYCDFKGSTNEPKVILTACSERYVNDEWISPSDLLIGVLQLKPPFTSRITRGKTHEGILSIGNGVLEKERARFMKILTDLLKDNDGAWSRIENQEKELVVKKVREFYSIIFEAKSKVMQKEIAKFYESTLQELEDHIKSEVQVVLTSAHTNMVSDLNIEIREKLRQENTILEGTLRKRYEGEVRKIKKYYKLLLNNEIHRNNQLVNKAIYVRNDAIKAFNRQIEADKATTTMYIMCTERKKCRIKQFLLENIQSMEISEIQQKIEHKQAFLEEYREKQTFIYDINKEWEEKTKKILQLFLKFISFSLKLLPEQTTFLLDLEKMVVLQLNEIQKTSMKASSILIDSRDIENTFKFKESIPREPVCEGEPFVIVGDTADSIPTPYGSRETLPSHADLPFLRVQRQFIYAKCQKMEEVRAYLESQRCKCMDPPLKPPSDTSMLSSTTETIPSSSSAIESESSNEPMPIKDTHRLHECPVVGCTDWAKRISFPYLNAYLDFTEKNFERVMAILDKPLEINKSPELMKAKDIAFGDLPFGATKELYHNVHTQYSSQEDLQLNKLVCYVDDCQCGDSISEKVNKTLRLTESPTKINMNVILEERRLSLRLLIQQNPSLLNFFTDECFDFQL